MAAETPREVVIIDREDVGMYFVRYTDRVKHGRYSPAQFDKRDSTLEEVELCWIESQPNLKLRK